MSYSSITSQASMALDETRNKAYLKALRQLVTEDSVLLDVGAGIAPFGLLAAKLGARKVYLIEPQSVINTVNTIARDNGVGDVVECIHGTIEEATIPEPVDIVTSCFTGNFLLSEDLLQSLFITRDKFLKQGGSLLPSLARSYAVPVMVPDLYSEHISRYIEPHLGIDYSHYRKYASSKYYQNFDLTVFSDDSNQGYLSEPQQVLELDFYTAQSSAAVYDHDLSFTANRDGTCHGFIGWFDMQLNGRMVSTGPMAPPMHWSPLWFPIDEPITVKEGDEINIKIKKPLGGYYSWSISNNGMIRAHSESLNELLARTKKSKLKHQSQAMLIALNSLDSGKSVEQTAYVLAACMSNYFDLQSAQVYVQQLEQEHLL